MSVKFEDNSIKVKAELNDTTIAWLHTWSGEIASQAKRGCNLTRNDVGVDLKGSYANNVDESKGEASIGSPHEAAYWEEWGTGEYAYHGDGRKGWWVYVEGEHNTATSQVYYTEKEARGIAAGLRAQGLPAIATNGRQPSHTLENAFDAVREKAISDLKEQLGERMGK